MDNLLKQSNNKLKLWCKNMTDCERRNFALSKIDGPIDAFAGKNSEVISDFLNLTLMYE